MINVRVIAIDQRFVFGARGQQQLQNFMVLELPGGGEVRAAIDEDTVKRLMVMDAQSPSSEERPIPLSSTPAVAPRANGSSVRGLQPPPSAGRFPAPTLTEASEFGGDELDAPVGATEAETTAWLQLPDSVLSPAMKAAFSKLEAPPRMTPAQVRGLEREIMGKFGPEEWQEVLGPQWELLLGQATAPAPKPQPRPAPTVGAVTWADGAPLVGGSRPSRTVQKTEMGYPVLNDGTVDPGEVVGGSDRDEDGVGQL